MNQDDIEMKLRNLNDSNIIDNKAEDTIQFSESKKNESLEINKLAIETCLVILMRKFEKFRKKFT